MSLEIQKENNKWRFRLLNGRNNYIRELAYCYDILNADFYIVEEGDYDTGFDMFFSSIHLDHLLNPQEVYEKGLKLIQMINGASYLIHEDYSDVTIIGLENLYNSNNEAQNVRKSINNFVFDIDFTKANFENERQRSNSIIFLIEQAKQDPFLLNLLYCLGVATDFKTLFQVWDLFCDNRGEKATTKHFTEMGVPVDEITGFKKTANNFSALGTAARHGPILNAPKIEPISLEEAHKLISKLARIEIKERYNWDLPLIKSKTISADDLFD
ncbi:hypothetical protein [Sphingobacterium sp. GVS05A]|uniref:hypothetical protein n=1 Tax=Sphingobacterium sp. GVS05A TaxID=2862679 RepID=UPI001CC0B6AD|nr:hypothetical protein [Sphingobacterium sp. GVS05A]